MSLWAARSTAVAAAPAGPRDVLFGGAGALGVAGLALLLLRSGRRRRPPPSLRPTRWSPSRPCPSAPAAATPGSPPRVGPVLSSVSGPIRAVARSQTGLSRQHPRRACRRRSRCRRPRRRHPLRSADRPARHPGRRRRRDAGDGGAGLRGDLQAVRPLPHPRAAGLGWHVRGLHRRGPRGRGLLAAPSSSSGCAPSWPTTRRRSTSSSTRPGCRPAWPTRTSCRCSTSA